MRCYGGLVGQSAWEKRYESMQNLLIMQKEKC